MDKPEVDKPEVADRPVEPEGRQVEQPEERKEVEHRADKQEAPETPDSAIPTLEVAIQMMPQGGGRISLAIKTGPNCFSSKL